MINKNFLNLSGGYLFPQIVEKTRAFAASHPEAKIIRLGVGDAVLPLTKTVINAIKKAADEMADPKTFRGYPPEEGYQFLREAVAKNFPKSCKVLPGEVFISDGAASDLGNILDIFCSNLRVLIPNPTYPAYADTNTMSGNEILYAVGSAENDFLPMPDPAIHADLIYLCSPNNPTGAVYDRGQLAAWVDYANQQGAVIIFDSAYSAFIKGKKYPKSIFEIAGARTCCIEISSFSKSNGFTGVRCGFTVVPHELYRGGVLLNSLWLRRQTTKFNGVSYLSQRAAEAALSKSGKTEAKTNLSYYQKNAAIIRRALGSFGFTFFGGKNSPYIWLKCPHNMSSWAFFDYLLKKCQIVCTPGVGFGIAGEGFVRLSAFCPRADLRIALSRLRALALTDLKML